MLLASQSENVQAQFSAAEVSDYVALLKPRVMSLVVFTAFVGLVRAPVPMHPVLAFTALLCIAVGAGAAGALNMWYDADIDARMQRTSARPIPAGRILPGSAPHWFAPVVTPQPRWRSPARHVFGSWQEGWSSITRHRGRAFAFRAKRSAFLLWHASAPGNREPA